MPHIQNTTATVRWFEDGCSFDKRSAYKAVCTLSYLDDEEVFLHGMHGQVERLDMVKLLAKLKTLGVKRVIAVRKGKFITRDIDYLIRYNEIHNLS